MSLHLCNLADKSAKQQIVPMRGELPTLASAIASNFAAS
jgi:hypothetical protein